MLLFLYIVLAQHSSFRYRVSYVLDMLLDTELQLEAVTASWIEPHSSKDQSAAASVDTLTL